jgi:EAL domain-containing protein (putative c-di-GMP-specific phosphodiesterase class I)/cellobiose-specific phosphotransferase system component IIC
MNFKSLSPSSTSGLPVRQYILVLLSDLRSTLLWIMPAVVLFSFLTFIIGLTDFFTTDRSQFAQLISSFYQHAHTFFSYLLTTALTFTVAMRLRQPRPTLVLLSLSYLTVFHFLTQFYPTGIALQNLVAIITPLYAVPLIAWLRHTKLLGKHQLPNTSSHLTEAVNLIMPSLLVLLIVLMVNIVILEGWSIRSPSDVTLKDIEQSPYWYGTLFSLISAISHFLGIHSIYTLSFLHDPFFQALSHNIHSHQQGGGDLYLLNWTTAPVFSLLGGAGSTLALIIAILLLSKQKYLRTIALISIPLSFFNINEILIFAIPVIFNPILFFPFLLAPILNICISLYAMELGLVSHSVVSVPFVSPIFFNAYIATGGDFNAVILQLCCLFVSSCVYLPFIKLLDNMHTGQSIYFSKLDTYYSRKQEEAAQINEDMINKAALRRKQTNELEARLKLISQVEFYLEYQPQVSSLKNSVIGAEALIRATDGMGNTYLPMSFLPWLEKAGLMGDLDLWVVNQAIKDIKTMKRQGCNVPVSLNFSAETLLDSRAINKILSQLENSDTHGLFNIEVTETSLLEKDSLITSVFDKFHAMGFKVHIDDFGTGYSSLSYLPKFEIDKIKIDRSFLISAQSIKGKNLILALLEVAASQRMGVVIEGVETEDQLKIIPKDSDISIQGWYFSRSLKLNDFLYYYNNMNPKNNAENSSKP